MKKNMSRRDFMKIASMASAGGILAACQPSGTATVAPQAQGPTPVPPAAKTVTITFTGWGGAEEDQG